MSKNNYWTQEINKAIAEYNKTKDEALFAKTIYPAFNSLALYWALQYKDRLGRTKEDLQSYLVCFLFDKIGKYTEGRNGYAYFGTIAKFECNLMFKTLQKEKIRLAQYEYTYNIEKDQSGGRTLIEVNRDKKPIEIPEDVWEKRYEIREAALQISLSLPPSTTKNQLPFTSLLPSKLQKQFPTFKKSHIMQTLRYVLRPATRE